MRFGFENCKNTRAARRNEFENYVERVYRVYDSHDSCRSLQKTSQQIQITPPLAFRPLGNFVFRFCCAHYE